MLPLWPPLQPGSPACASGSMTPQPASCTPPTSRWAPPPATLQRWRSTPRTAYCTLAARAVMLCRYASGMLCVRCTCVYARMWAGGWVGGWGMV